MKKIFVIFLLFIILNGCAPKKSLQNLIDEINLPTEVTENLTLPNSYTLNGERLEAIWNSSNLEIINTDGTVNRDLNEHNVTLFLILEYQNQILTKEFNITVLPLDKQQFLNLAIDSLNIPLETKEDLNLPQSLLYKGRKINLTWNSNNLNALSNDGKVGLIVNDTEIELIVEANLDNITCTKSYNIKILALSKTEQSEYVLNNIEIDEMIVNDINLPTTFAFNITGTWESSNQEVLLNSGKIAPNFNGSEEIILTLTLDTGDRREFKVIVSKNTHLIIDRDFLGTKENLKIDSESKLVLNDDAIEGTYESEIIKTLPFIEAVASWAAISSQVATCELMIRVQVDNVWSKYFTYGKWGLGLENRSYNQEDNIAKLSTDEIIINNGKKATALQLKIILRRDNVTKQSPKVSLLAVALNIPNYNFPVNIDNISKTRDYNVPKLNQNVVPNIGGVICSATSSTMLLKYKGHNFLEQDELEHRYIAGIVKDYGHNIYGNWVYNTVGMSALGEVSYVKRMYSYQELLYHLDNYGPVAASVKGVMIGEIGKTWTTSGHLIVVRGYRIEEDEIYILANDPNMTNVYEEYKLDNFLNVWRNIVYVIE